MIKVLILFGSRSYEHEVSCNSVNFVIKNIEKKYNYTVCGIDFNNEWYEVNNSNIDINWKNNTKRKIDNIIHFIKEFDIVFPVIHGNTFEDGKLQSIFEMNNVKYVGCNSYSSLICYDKILTKIILEKYNIPQIPYIIYDDKLDLNNIEFPVIVKPSKCGSSIGINVANNKKELKKAIKEAYKYDSKILIENFIQNKRELECAILENNKKIIISDIGEIINKGVYDYNSKYKYKIDTKISNIDESIKQSIKDLSKKIFKIMECKDLSRIDFIYDLDNKKLYFNEINTMPGFTDISMYPKLIINSGISASNLIDILLSS